MEESAKGAASSLRKSISELEQFVGRASARSQSARGGLRGRLDELIWEVGRKAFEAGYRAAHLQCAEIVEQSQEFPVTIKFSGNPRVAPSVIGVMSIRSSVQKVKFFKLPTFAREVSFWERFRKKRP